MNFLPFFGLINVLQFFFSFLLEMNFPLIMIMKMVMIMTMCDNDGGDADENDDCLVDHMMPNVSLSILNETSNILWSTKQSVGSAFVWPVTHQPVQHG